MKARDELVIHIVPEKLELKVESIAGDITTVKNISLETFFECIKSSMRRDAVASGLLPPYCFHIAIDSQGNREYCLWYPELFADISYYGTEYPHFPLPRLVFKFQVADTGKVGGCQLGVIKNEKLSEDTPMYIYPFSNVSGFHLCVGNNALPVYKKTQTLATLPGFLLRLPNNNDSFNPQHNKLGMQYRDLLEHLKKKGPAYYYTDVLVESNKTLKDFINGR